MKEVTGDDHEHGDVLDDPSIENNGEDDEQEQSSKDGRQQKSESSSPSASTCSSSSPPEETTKMMKVSMFIDKHRRPLLIALTGLLVVILACIVGVSVVSGRKGNENTSGQQQANYVQDESAANGDLIPKITETTLSPSISKSPSEAPSSIPSDSPSSIPSDVPSIVPSQSPSQTPTASPTFKLLPVNPVPDDVDPTYFNYDPTSRYGPHNWKIVDTTNSWLGQFGKDGWGPWSGIRDERSDELTKMICNAPNGQQSPKDLRGLGWNCSSIHEIRTKCGVDPLASDVAYQKLILPHKLSIVAKGRPCLEVLENGYGIDECRLNQPPMVDYPRYSSEFVDYADMHHFDIKLPGEHTIEGEEFDAEIQMFHVHLEDGRFSSIGIPVRATNDGFNQEFQFILDEFQRVYDIDAEECEMMNSGTLSDIARSSWESWIDSATNTSSSIPDDGRNLRGTEPIMTDLRSIENLEQEKRGTNSSPHASKRKLLLVDEIHKQQFNPYSDAFMTTMFFYRYDGSMTEPPCRTLTWWVMKDPMYINFNQLGQLRDIMFTHVDRNCQRTSVHNAQNSVARPLHPFSDESVVEFCQEGDFESDESKGRPPGKQCKTIDMPEP